MLFLHFFYKKKKKVTANKCKWTQNKEEKEFVTKLMKEHEGDRLVSVSFISCPSLFNIFSTAINRIYRIKTEIVTDYEGFE